jgi:sigma-B regulation protein RsbU (phosphoserine phosphatase)
MNERLEWVEGDWASRYAAALEAHCAGSGATPSSRASLLGRQAVAGKASLADLASIHHRALGGLSARAFTPEQRLAMERKAAEFLRDALSPFERALRDCYEANLAKDRTIAELKRSEDALYRRQDELARVQSLELATAAATLRAEVGERKLTEIALRESEARFRAIFESAGIGIALLDKKGRVRECNLALQKMLGYGYEDLHGRIIFELSYPDDIAVSEQRFQGLVEGRYRHYNLEKRFIGKDGTVLWVRKIVSGVYGFRDELLFAIDMIEDITESKLADEALRESEARFRQIVDMTCEWIWEQDAEGRYSYSSNAVRNILGFGPEEIIGRNYWEFFFPEDRERPPAAIPGHETLFRLINRYRHKDGREVFTESTGIPISDSRGRVLKWRGVDHDVTERKRFEDALRLRDRAIEASSVGIIITDPHQPGHPIIYANPAFIRMSGRSRDEVIGRNPRFLQGPGTDPAAIEAIGAALREGRNCHLTLRNYRKDGTPFWNELFISPVRDPQGRLTHFIGTQTDVTVLKQVEEERHEMEIARQIQLSLLPSAPLQVNGAQMAGYCLPAVHVGGDYFDYFATENAVDIVIADVSGHSVGAALIMAETRSTLKMETHWMMKGQSELTNGADKTLALLNDLLFEDLNRADFFISMFYLTYRADTREIAYANAGHNCPLLLRRGARECVELDADGLILGIRKGVGFEEKKLVLSEGDMLLLYTDGVTEARNERGEFFGVPRLCELFVAHAGASPQDLIQIVVAELGRFCRSRSFDDDISLVVLKAI